MTTASYSYGSLTSALTTTLNSVAGGAAAVFSSTIDNSSGHMALEVELTFAMAAASTDTVTVGLAASADGGTDFETEAQVRHVVTATANGTNTVRKVARIWDLPKHFQLTFKNNASATATAASGNTVSYRWVDPVAA